MTGFGGSSPTPEPFAADTPTPIPINTPIPPRRNTLAPAPTFTPVPAQPLSGGSGPVPAPTGISCDDINPLLVPSCAFREIPRLTALLLNLAIVGGAGLTLLMFLVGGFYYLNSRDNPGRREQAVKTILWAVVGLVTVASAYVAMQLLGSAVNIDVFG